MRREVVICAVKGECAAITGIVWRTLSDGWQSHTEVHVTQVRQHGRTRGRSITANHGSIITEEFRSRRGSQTTTGCMSVTENSDSTTRKQPSHDIDVGHMELARCGRTNSINRRRNAVDDGCRSWNRDHASMDIRSVVWTRRIVEGTLWKRPITAEHEFSGENHVGRSMPDAVGQVVAEAVGLRDIIKNGLRIGRAREHIITSGRLAHAHDARISSGTSVTAHAAMARIGRGIDTRSIAIGLTA